MTTTSFSVRRSHYFFSRILTRDWTNIFPQSIPLGTTTKVLYFSMLSRTAVFLTPPQEALLHAIPSTQWVSTETLASTYAPADLSRLIDTALVLSDRVDTAQVRYTELETKIHDTGWNFHALVSYCFAQWEDIHEKVGDYGRLDDDGNIMPNALDPRSILPSLPTAPNEFHTPQAAIETTIALPHRPDNSEFARIVLSRRSRRFFSSAPLPLTTLSDFLYLTFAAHGRLSILPTLTILKKSSASGGSLHPTECYAIILNVDGVAPGLYHYCVKDHTLSRLKRPYQGSLYDQAQIVAAGQYWVRSASAMLILASRFRRNFWKYRDHDKALQVCFLDIGHISQTCYMAAEYLNIAGCFGAAMSNVNANELLMLDGFSEGTLAFYCVGPRVEAVKRNLEPDYERYVPSRIKA